MFNLIIKKNGTYLNTDEQRGFFNKRAYQTPDGAIFPPCIKFLLRVVYSFLRRVDRIGIFLYIHMDIYILVHT